MPLEAPPGRRGAAASSPRSPSEALKPMLAPPPPPRIRSGSAAACSRRCQRAPDLVLVVALARASSASSSCRAAGRPSRARSPPTRSWSSRAARHRRDRRHCSSAKASSTRPSCSSSTPILNRQRGQLKAGEFLFKAARQHRRGDRHPDRRARRSCTRSPIPEGLTSEQIVGAAPRQRHPHRRRHRDAARGHAAARHLQVRARHDAPADSSTACSAAQREALNQIWARRSPDLPIKTPQELVILASIVEKETGRADERTRVAGVFINRLAKRMKLQSDPTIVYGLVGGKGTLGRGILRSRDRQGDALQHLCDRGPAAGADRQSRPRRARGGRQSVADEGPLFRRRRLGRPRLRRDLRPAQKQRRPLAPDREGPRRGRRARCVDRAEPPPGPDARSTPHRRRRRTPAPDPLLPGRPPARRPRRGRASPANGSTRARARRAIRSSIALTT